MHGPFARRFGRLVDGQVKRSYMNERGAHVSVQYQHSSDLAVTATLVVARPFWESLSEEWRPTKLRYLPPLKEHPVIEGQASGTIDDGASGVLALLSGLFSLFFFGAYVWVAWGVWRARSSPA